VKYWSKEKKSAIGRGAHESNSRKFDLGISMRGAAMSHGIPYSTF
jgi:hypothetical protein